MIDNQTLYFSPVSYNLNMFSITTHNPNNLYSPFNVFENGIVYNNLFGDEDFGLAVMLSYQWEWDINPQTDLVYQVKMY